MTDKDDRPDRLIILGIDPGTIIMGYGVVAVEGKKLTCLACDHVKFDTKRSPFERLEDIYVAMGHILKEHQPDQVAMEAPFFGKNVQSMLKLGRAQGIIMAASLAHEASVTEYSPRRVKQAVTGSGSASKEKVAGMVAATYGLSEMPGSTDASDGLAVATCHAYSINQVIPNQSKAKQGKKKTTSSWDAFLKANPDRIQ